MLLVLGAFGCMVDAPHFHPPYDAEPADATVPDATPLDAPVDAATIDGLPAPLCSNACVNAYSCPLDPGGCSCDATGDACHAHCNTECAGSTYSCDTECHCVGITPYHPCEVP